MDYKRLSTDEQAQILEARLRQYEQEHFGHATNLKVLSGQPDDESVRAAKQAAQEAMRVLDAAYVEAEKELRRIRPPAKAEDARRAKR